MGMGIEDLIHSPDGLEEGLKGSESLLNSLTDSSNGARLADRFGKNLKYCGPWGKWLVWNGGKWESDDRGIVMREARKAALSIWDEVGRAGGDKEQWAVAKWAIDSQGDSRLNAMLRQARDRLAILPHELDRDGWLFNVKNGTLDLRTGELKPHDREDLLTKQAPVEFDPRAECPMWLTFLAQITEGDREVQDYLCRVMGLSLTGDIREHCLWIFYGSGANGKSTFLETFAGMVGDYAMSSPPNLLVKKGFAEHPTEIADLCGRRFIFASESDEGELKIQLVKRLTGDAVLKGRYMRQDYFSFPRTFKLVLATNNKPKVLENSMAIWRRIKLVPFNVTIPEAKQDKELMEKLAAERSGILNWALAGCLQWLEDRRLKEPAAVSAASESYQMEESQRQMAQGGFGKFVKDFCVLTEDATAEKGLLYGAYLDAVGITGATFVLSKEAFFKRILGLKNVTSGWHRIDGKDKRVLHGIGLIPRTSDENKE